MTNLDKEFNELAKQINIKLKEASDALKEVNRLASAAKLVSLIDSRWVVDDMDEDEAEAFRDKLELIDVSDLEKELGNAGWSTSSSYC